VDELRELLSEALLRLRRSVLVWSVVQASGGDLGCEPVGFGEADGQRYEVLLDLLLRELLADLVEGLDGLEEVRM
jgi:hypothetical protein